MRKRYLKLYSIKLFLKRVKAMFISKQYLRDVKRKLFLKYVIVITSLTLTGLGIIYLFNDILNGVVIDFIQLFIVNGNPFDVFSKIYAVFLPLVIVFTGFILIYFLSRNLVNYMQTLMDGIDDVMQKDRVKIKFPEELKQAEELVLSIVDEYQNYLRSAQEDEEKKKDLIYLLAQDIKMPLSNIVMHLEFLQKEKRISPEIRKDFTLQILHKSMDLEDMINEFFDITRFNLQYAKWSPEKMYLDRMLEQVVDEYYEFMEEKHIRVNMNCAAQLALYSDSDKMARVMRDLMRNLIELGKEQATLSIQVEAFSEHYDITMSVTSSHLSADQIAHIFHNYYRLKDMHGTDKTHVLGLGIAKQIMDMQKGSLRASSIGDVLSFDIFLPIHKAKPLTL